MAQYRLPVEPDLFDRAVDYGGGYRYAQFFDLDSPTLLPVKPLPAARAGERCPCPACLTGGEYPVSPACRFWRADCPVCDGRRVYHYHRPRWWKRWRGRQENTGACLPCELAWHQDLDWFSYCLTHAWCAAMDLRVRAGAAGPHLTAAAPRNP